MSKNAVKVECKSDRLGFPDFTLDLIGKVNIPSLMPLPDIPDIKLPGIPFPKIEISLPKPKLPSPSASFKMKMDAFKFQIDMIKGIALDVPELPSIPPIPTPECLKNLVLGIESPECPKIPGLDIDLDDITPSGFKRVCVDVFPNGDDASFVKGGEIKVSIKDQNGGEISLKRIKKSEDNSKTYCTLLLSEVNKFVTVEITGMVIDSGGNKIQKKVSVKIDV